MMIDDEHPKAYQQRVLRIASILLMLFSPIWILLMFYTPEFELGAGIVLLPFLAVLTVVAAYQLARRDQFERKTLLAGATFKLLCCGMYNGMVFFIYSGGTDSVTYFRTGIDWAANFGMLGVGAIRVPYWGTPFVTMLAGILIYFVPSDAFIAGTFALVGFWGQYLFYRAFSIAFPEGDRRDMGLLVFLIPSLGFWSASVGKEAICILGIGLCAYGYARASGQANPTGYLIAGVGLAVTGLVRPHIGAMVALALALAISFSSTKKGVLGILNKFVGIPLIFVGTIYIVTRAQAFVNAGDFSSGVSSIQSTQHLSSVGGSGFGGSLISRILFAPFILFRPFPWEVRSLIMVAASLEGALFGIFFWLRRRNLWYAVQHWRHPFILFIFAFSIQFVVIFSAAISNFGILTRERVMLIPLAIMLTCLPRARRRKAIGVSAAGRYHPFGFSTVAGTSPAGEPPVPVSRI